MRLALLAAALLACGSDPPPRSSERSRPRPVTELPGLGPGGCPIEPRPAERQAPGRLVAIGDLHGDLAATRAALQLAGAIDGAALWAGGDLTVVQLGDVLDRGNDEQAIIDLFERLEGEAASAGGSFIWLLGNHELMNGAGDFSYVTEGGWRDFEDAPGADPSRSDIATALAQLPAANRPRAAAMLPGGAYARIFSGQEVAVVVGGNVLSHAGFEESWARDLPAMNRESRCFLEGAGPLPSILRSPDSPIWTRVWGLGPIDCERLDAVLRALDAERMVVAHTPQLTGITSECAGRLWRIDTGMSAYYGGPIQVLDLSGGSPRVLSTR
jgi:hypothetical protein